jgi:uncharacterized membrane protein
MRRPYIDWLRGVAVLIMISWHSIDSWMVQGGRDTAAFGAVIFIAGWAAPLFLFLAGVSLPFAAGSRMARGASRAEAGRALRRRGWEIFILAHLFRFQSFLLNPHGEWNALLKPDILNILALGIVLTAYCWERAGSDAGLGRWLLLPSAVVVLVLTPWSRVWWWPTLLHPRLEAYIRPVGNYGVFTLFPAVAYVLLGGFVGARLAARDPRDAAIHGRLTLYGLAAVAGGLAAMWLPPAWQRVGVDALAIVLARTGAMTAALGVSWFLLRHRPRDRWSPVVVFGRTSLFVYWVHVELAYGVFSYPWRHALTLPGAVGAYLLLTLFMLGCAVLWARRPPGPLVPAHMVARLDGPRRAEPRQAGAFRRQLQV